MSASNPVYRIGAATVTRIDEVTLTGATPSTLYPGASPAEWEPHLDKLGSGSFDRDAGTLVQSIHSWLVRTPEHVVLIDTATGNGKDRPYAPVLDHLDEPFLARLADAGVRPEDVDYVLLTHVHADHVGWNTERRDGAWTPVFPRARHLVSAREVAYGAALDRGDEPDPAALAPGLGRMARRPSPGVFADSLRPVMDAGLVDLVAVDGQEVVPGFAFVSTPGHSIDHASIRLRQGGEEALFAGDLFHHPLQVYAPGLTSTYCEFPEAALRSRLTVLEDAAARGVPLFTTHCAETSVGRVSRAGAGFAWSFV